MVWMVVAALAGTVTEDFDGDGKKDTITWSDDQSELTLPGVTTPIGCEMGCELEVLDILADKPGKELAVCVHLGRDDRSCTLYKQAAGKWAKLAVPVGEPTAFATRGTGFVHAWYTDVWYSRLEKLQYDGTKITHVPQPFWSTANEMKPDGFTFVPDRVFPIVTAPGGSSVVANVAPGNTVYVLVESIDQFKTAAYDESKRWFLVRTTSGLVGWVSLATMIKSSDLLYGMSNAG